MRPRPSGSSPRRLPVTSDPSARSWPLQERRPARRRTRRHDDWNPRRLLCSARRRALLLTVQAATLGDDGAMPSRGSRTHGAGLLCYLAGALCGVTLVLGPDQGGHVPVVLRCCRGKTAVCGSDLCCYLVQRQRGHVLHHRSTASMRVSPGSDCGASAGACRERPASRAASSTLARTQMTDVGVGGAAELAAGRSDRGHARDRAMEPG